MHVEHVLIPVPPLLHVSAQGRDGGRALLERWEASQERHVSQRTKVPR